MAMREFTLGDCCDIAEEATKRLAVSFNAMFAGKEPPTISPAMVRHVLQVAAETKQRQEANDEQ